MDGSLVQEINFFPPKGGKKFKRADQGIVTNWFPLPDRWKRRRKSLNLGKGKKKDPNKGTRFWREAGIQQATQSAAWLSALYPAGDGPRVPLLVVTGGARA